MYNYHNNNCAHNCKIDYGGEIMVSGGTFLVGCILYSAGILGGSVWLAKKKKKK